MSNMDYNHITEIEFPYWLKTKDSKVVGHLKQGRRLKGDRNPAKRPDVRKKISEAVKRAHKEQGILWKKGKTPEQISEINKKKLTRNQFARRYPGPGGIRYRSTLEVEVAKILSANGIPFVYEKPLRLGGNRWVLPDFTIENAFIIEVTGLAYSKWRKSFEERLQRIWKVYPNLSVLVVTYPEFSPYMLKWVGKYDNHLDLFAFGDHTPDIIILELESGKFKFDYSHVLPFHQGKCNRFHGHSSQLEVTVVGLPDSYGMVVDFGIAKKVVRGVIDQYLDHKFLVSEKYILSIEDEKCYIRFETSSGIHEMVLPEEEVVSLEVESTVESIACFIASEILVRLPGNVVEIWVAMFEGVGNRAIASMGTGNDYHLHKLNEIEVQHFIKAIQYHRKVCQPIGGVQNDI